MKFAVRKNEVEYNIFSKMNVLVLDEALSVINFDKYFYFHLLKKLIWVIIRTTFKDSAGQKLKFKLFKRREFTPIIVSWKPI